MTKVLYPGSFDPITKGHMDIINQASALFDKVVVAVMYNPAKDCGMFVSTQRMEMIEKIYENVDNVEVIIGEDTTVDTAINNGCDAIIRGLRSVSDYDYEAQLQQINKELSDGKINTICLFADKKYQFVSSSMVKELFRLNKNTDRYIHPYVRERMWYRRKEVGRDLRY